MFAVFYKGEFIDFWLNLSTDQGWIERTIQIKNWHPDHVEVCQYLNDIRNIGPIFFDDSRAVVPLVVSEMQVEINGESQMKTVYEPNYHGKVEPIFWFKQGQRLLNYM